MAEKKETEKTVTLWAPNGQQVTVAASKKDARVAGGYKTSKPPAKKAASSKSND